MRPHDSFAPLKATGLALLGGLAVSAVFYWKTFRPLAPRGPAAAVAVQQEPLPAAAPVADRSPNPWPVRGGAESTPVRPGADTPMVFTGIDQRYHEALLAGLDAPDSSAQESAFCEKLSEWIRRSPGSVEASVNEISQRYGPNTALRVTAQLWAEEDPEGAREWALRSGNGGQRLKILASVYYQVAQRDPLAAMEGVKAELDRTPDYEAAAAPLVVQWARKDRVAALAWVNAQPEGDIRNQLRWQIEQTGTSANPVLTQQP